MIYILLYLNIAKKQKDLKNKFINCETIKV